MFIDHIHDQLGRYRVGIIDEAMPDFIKTAEEAVVTDDLTKLADGCFAYSTGRERYYPLHTPEHAWLSRAYFEKFAHTIEEPLVDKIRARIDDACQAFEVPPISLEKFAAQEDEMDSLHALSIEIKRFLDAHHNMTPSDRRLRAKHLVHHAKALGRETSHLPELLQRYGGDHLSENFSQAINARMNHFHSGAPEREALLGIQHCASKHVPEVLARVLDLLDHKLGLAKHYGQGLDDAYYSTLSSRQRPTLPSEFDFLKGQDFEPLRGSLSDELIDALKADPVSAFSSMEPSVKIIVVRKINA